MNVARPKYFKDWWDHPILSVRLNVEEFNSLLKIHQAEAAAAYNKRQERVRTAWSHAREDALHDLTGAASVAQRLKKAVKATRSAIGAGSARFLRRVAVHLAKW